MIVEVVGQYFLSVIIGGMDTFLNNEDDFKSIIITEEAGNVLPTFQMEFLIRKEHEKLFKYLNEGSIVDISLGKSRNDAITTQFVIQGLKVQRHGKESWEICIVGLHNSMKYLAESKIWASGNVSGVECIQSKISSLYTPDFNISSSSDSQYWVQHNTSDRKFVTDVWLHSYIPESFICVGISFDGTFILKDIKKESGSKWDFAPGKIEYFPDYSIESRSGLMNHWAGFGRDRTVWNQNTEEFPTSNEEFKPILAQADYLNRSSEIGNRIFEYRPINDNVHENYWNAWKRNVTSLSLFSTSSVTLEFQEEYKPMRVLDRVYFEDERAMDNAPPIVYHSGYYYLTHITRRVDHKVCSTVVKLCRESLSETTGNLR